MAKRRRPLLDSVRRRPFAWAFATTLVASVGIRAYASNERSLVETDVSVWIAFVVEVVALLLPAMVAVRWRGIGRGARVAALAVCALWWAFEWDRVVASARDMREFVPNMWAVREITREPLRAMRTPPAEAAARALAAGDSSFLAHGGSCGSVPGVDSAVAHPQGVRVIRGTYHDGEPLTPEHLVFNYDAFVYAERYNDAVAERLGIETIRPDGRRGCFDLAPMRGRAPLSWP